MPGSKGRTDQLAKENCMRWASWLQQSPAHSPWAVSLKPQSFHPLSRKVLLLQTLEGKMWIKTDGTTHFHANRRCCFYPDRSAR